MPYPIYTLKSAIGYFIKIAEGYDQEAVTMQRQVEKLSDKPDMVEIQKRYSEIVKHSLQKARQHRSWAKELKKLLGD